MSDQQTLSDEDIKRMGRAVGTYLSPADCATVCFAIVRRGREFAVLLSAEIGGQTVTAEELAAACLRIAKRALASGGAS
jgi:hypothetical protein